MLNDIKTNALFNHRDTITKVYIEDYEYPWEIVTRIEEIIMEISAALDKSEYYSPEAGVWISKHAKIAESAYIGAPAIVMTDAEIRHSAYIRRGALICPQAVVGNSTEVKNAILMEGAAAPHFNYVGDSILGYKAHIGAGVICSNLRLDKSEILIHTGEKTVHTGAKKLGAIIGDLAEIGSGSVLNPGTIILPSAKVYPLSSVRGVIK